MSASFFKRLTSSIIDITLVFLVVYLAFIIGGKTLLQNRIDNFDEIYASYNEIIDAYNNDLTELQTEYQVAKELADGDVDLENLALEEYRVKTDLLREQNTIDIEPFNEPLTSYFLSNIYFYTIGFIILTTLLTVLTTGRTPGRRLMQIKLAQDLGNGEFAKPNPIFVFFHDIMFKYFFIAVVVMWSIYYGALLLLLVFIFDLALILITKQKTTIRDMVLKIKVVKSGYGN